MEIFHKNYSYGLFLLICSIFFVDNFGDSDFDFLQTFGTAPSSDANAGRDSVLMKFDPLLERSRPVDNQTQFRLSIPKEEEEELAVQNCLIENQEASFNDNSCISSNLLPSLFSSLSEKHEDNADMKEIELESKSSESYQETKESEGAIIRYV